MKYFLLMQKYLLPALIAFQLGITAASAAILNIPQKNQEKSEWCWAASSQAILEYYGVVKTQTEIADYGTEGANIWNYLWGIGKNPPRNGVDKILLHFGTIGSSGSDGALSQSVVQTQMDAGRPVVVNWEWTSGGAHILVGHGIDGDTMYLMDPWDGPTIDTYDWVVKGDNHEWKWSLKITSNPPESVIQDCNGEWGGTAFIDNCGECVEGNTGKTACEQDCNGDHHGTAFIDNCGECVGGNTGKTACEQDCNGDWGGTAFIDECEECVGGDTGKTACEQDCNGNWGGTAFFDNCDECVGGDTGKEACIQDCNEEWGGTAFIDKCGKCVGGSTQKIHCVDISDDGAAGLNDIILALKILSERDTGDVAIDLSADINEDGKIGMPEVIHLLRTLALQ
ncbi:C39 family peptidase [Desulfonema magnum]|uniref:Peptidase domain-containing protein n=1 Tax=Desulfonema magnum TaxID=45655 RepID=A0A975GQ32_9BACT|nr:C39 family peptidase [Desulfonema magnum]QTA88528.1 Peptidase domain-containing protein [Desulfonema magnum]